MLESVKPVVCELIVGGRAKSLLEGVGVEGSILVAAERPGGGGVTGLRRGLMAVLHWPKKTLWIWLLLLLGGPVVLAFFSRASFIEPPLAWRPVYEPGQGGATVSLAVSPHDPKKIISGGDMLGIAMSEDAGETWQQPMGLKGYEMGDITWHPTDGNVVWTGSASGPYVSMDAGRNWEQRREGFPAVEGGRYSAMVERVVFDPRNLSRLVAVGGSSRRWNQSDTFGWVWESVDGGRKWKHLTTVFEGASREEKAKGLNLVAVAFGAGETGRVYALGEGSGVYVSEDGGKTWKRSESFPVRNVQRLAVHPTKGETAWVCTAPEKRGDEAGLSPGGVYRTDDGGKSWVEITGNLPQTRGDGYKFTAGFEAMSVSPMDPDVIWVNDHRWNTGVIYRTEDGGKHWKAVATKQNVGQDVSTPEQKALAQAAKVETANPAGLALAGLTACPKDSLTVYGFGTEFLIRSRDGGATWTDITAYRPDAAKPDHWRGRGWTGWCARNIGFNPYREGQLVLQAMDAGRVWISDDGMRSWRYPAREPNPWGAGNDVTFTKDGTIFATTGQFGQFNGILRSKDWGATFQTLAGEAHGLAKAGWEPGPEGAGIYAHPDNSKLVWAVLGGRLMQSTDGGGMWSEVEESPRDVRWLAGDPTKAGRFYLSAADGIYVIDNGTTAIPIGGPSPAGRGKLNVDSKGRVLACQWRSDRAGVWRFDPAEKDAAKAWTRLSDDYYAFECVADPTDPQRLVLVTHDDPYHDHATGSGVWVSHDGGAGWSAANTDLPVIRAEAAAFDPFDRSKVVIGTVGRGFFTARWPASYKPEATRRYVSTAEDAAWASLAARDERSQKFRAVNGSMSDPGPTAGGPPAGWEGRFVASGELKVSRDEVVFVSAPASLRVESVGGAVNGQANQMHDGAPGEKITVSGSLRTRGTAKVNFAVQTFTADWKPIGFEQIGYAQGNTEWAKKSKDVTLPAGTARFAILVLVEGEGTAWLDDVVLKAKAKAATK